MALSGALALALVLKRVFGDRNDISWTLNEGQIPWYYQGIRKNGKGGAVICHFGDIWSLNIMSSSDSVNDSRHFPLCNNETMTLPGIGPEKLERSQTILSKREENIGLGS